MRNILFSFLSSIAVVGIAVQTCVAADIKPVAGLVRQRLSHMQNVALYKKAHHIPVEDLTQEARVMAHSLDLADSLGLDRDSVRSFVDLQMKAAKAIQYRYLGGWLFASKIPVAPQSLDEDRREIAELGNDLLKLLAFRLKHGQTVDVGDQSQFSKILHAYDLREIEKQKLFRALLHIKLATA